MSADRDFDQLLAGVPTPDQQRLASLLAAAAAPAGAEELAGEQEMVVAFRQAHLADPHSPRRRSMFKLAFAKLLTVKVAAGAAAATVAGGAALAATGNMPGPLSELGVGALRPAPAESAADHAGEAGAGGIGQASPSPSLEGLCEAFLAEVADAPGRALESPAFQVLITNAGGEDEVAAFCAELLPERSGDVPRVEPEAAPTGLPAGPPVEPGPPVDRLPIVPPTDR
jgi:hypothetical protein